jgi:hypothetical protein
LQAALDGKQPLAPVLTNTTASFTTAQEAKLAGIAAGATANAADSALRDRSTHTGTQAASTITGLATVATTGAYGDLSGRPTLFSGAYGDLTGRPTLFSGAYGDLSGVPSTFAPSAHSHAIADVTGLQAALDGKQDAGALGTFAHFIAPGLAAGTFITNAVNGLALGTTAGVAGRLEMSPFIPSRTITIDRLSIEVTTAVASAQARVGIYGTTAGGLPGDLLTGQGTLLDCSATGAKGSDIAGGLTLQAGTVYWLAAHSSSTATLRALAVGGLLPLGNPETGTTHNSGRRASVTFASGLPTTAPSAALLSGSMPRIAMRLA